MKEKGKQENEGKIERWKENNDRKGEVRKTMKRLREKIRKARGKRGK